MRVQCDKTEAGVVCHLVGNFEGSTVDQFRDAVAQFVA